MSELKRVLIIEDDEGMRKELKRVFEKDGEFVATTAVDLKEAEECLKKTPFDVAIIDMRFQEDQTGGLKIVREGYSHFRTVSPELLSIIYTAYPSLETCVEAMRLGAWNYIDKKSEDSMNKLVQSVKEGLEKRFSSETGPDSHWLEAHLPELKRRHGNRFIALIDEEVKAEGAVLDKLREEMEEKYPDKKPYYLWIPQG